MITKFTLYESPNLRLILPALCFHIYDSSMLSSSQLHKLPWPCKAGSRLLAGEAGLRTPNPVWFSAEKFFHMEERQEEHVE